MCVSNESIIMSDGGVDTKTKQSILTYALNLTPINTTETLSFSKRPRLFI